MVRGMGQVSWESDLRGSAICYVPIFNNIVVIVIGDPKKKLRLADFADNKHKNRINFHSEILTLLVMNLFFLYLFKVGK
mgnify:CR=1 FL=1